MVDSSAHYRGQGAEGALRVLLAIHGHEPAEWPSRACRLVSSWKGARLRVLAVIDVPGPAFTSLIGPARRRYASARSAWRRDAEQHVQDVIARMAPALPADLEVVRDWPSGGRVAEALIDHAMAWPADVIVMAAPSRPQRWGWPGPVHRRVLRDAGCPVLAIPPETAPRLARRRSSVPYPAAPGLRPAATDRGV